MPLVWSYIDFKAVIIASPISQSREQGVCCTFLEMAQESLTQKKNCNDDITSQKLINSNDIEKRI